MGSTLLGLFAAALFGGLIATLVLRAAPSPTSARRPGAPPADAPDDVAPAGPARSPSLVQRIRLGLFSPDRERRRSAVLKLGLLSGERSWSVQELTALLRDLGGDPEVRALAAQALARLGTVTPDVVAALHAALMDKNPALVLAALRAARQLGPQAAELAPDAERLARVPDERLRQEAALTLGSLGRLDDRAATTLWDVAENEAGYAWPARLEAAVALLGADPAHAVRLLPVLQMALRTGSPTDRERAGDVLALFAPPHLPLLAGLLRDEAPAVRVVAARALRRCDRTAVAPVVHDALRHDDPAVRAEAVLALGRLLEPGEASLRQLVPILTDGNASVRQTAIRVLASWGTGMIPAMLHELAQRGGEYTRRPFYAAIEAMGAPALPELRALFNAGTPAQRREVILAMTSLGGLGAEPAAFLEQVAAGDADAALRIEAQNGLRALQRRTAGIESTAGRR